ncbi:winged helix-turn-helix transcriptional regulator [Methanogenium cariaci]|jgi:DNA-binding HxlR family transcriptional regulator
MHEGCTVYQTTQYLTKKWALLVLFELYKGDDYTRRFSELKESLAGITSKVLSQRLKELEEEGLVGRRVDAEHFPVKSEYFLTEAGLGLIDVIKHLKQWALTYKIDNIDCGNQNCKDCIL